MGDANTTLAGDPLADYRSHLYHAVEQYPNDIMGDVSSGVDRI